MSELLEFVEFLKLFKIKTHIKFAGVFWMSFICFNQGMNDFFADYIITRTNMAMIFLPLLAVGAYLINGVLEYVQSSENKVIQ